MNHPSVDQNIGVATDKLKLGETTNTAARRAERPADGLGGEPSHMVLACRSAENGEPFDTPEC
ncbi:hypothetical protein [Burkholderia thailandensis]|uniref:Uncharacterized protein n=1 Tax=Burkholderia thailandensis TaxID=57975 RepID=A0AAW9D566_BURTH|nr:hypothetical protein [Burkholderia thailandensis]MCS3393608.1 hypothetical protein [Burkholderia thailandensis]MCS6454477.1 hypothetical protein [Burkholderia thailandensis]MCS6466230.1 hypothetical protein [Burkholderia thailandensis]MCS6483717.1 hypothetical protein [Burkholderia thailandensis]MCS6489688.1 hypothetical protein [Burkholderia thailandensis]